MANETEVERMLLDLLGLYHKYSFKSGAVDQVSLSKVMQENFPYFLPACVSGDMPQAGWMWGRSESSTLVSGIPALGEVSASAGCSAACTVPGLLYSLLPRERWMKFRMGVSRPSRLHSPAVTSTPTPVD